ncbi:hypothetical protein BU16DRAFT_622372 [Lophium mytilinum]|uniref:Uncharacterized protein n=1 Tax=Lophium mytilinum TaxID=390894 RepID=A0A6A6QBH2_9PEZI|nr:hypothetical protein BU16DRAFT_622372 [Lophium mytilinum]
MYPPSLNAQPDRQEEQLDDKGTTTEIVMWFHSRFTEADKISPRSPRDITEVSPEYPPETRETAPKCVDRDPPEPMSQTADDAKVDLCQSRSSVMLAAESRAPECINIHSPRNPRKKPPEPEIRMSMIRSKAAASVAKRIDDDLEKPLQLQPRMVATLG